MEKSLIILVLACAVAGCSAAQEKVEMYKDNPEYLVKDPEFADFKTNLDRLERSYLAKEITYAEYLEKKEELDKKYNTNVKKRDDIMSGANQY